MLTYILFKPSIIYFLSILSFSTGIAPMESRSNCSLSVAGVESIIEMRQDLAKKLYPYCAENIHEKLAFVPELPYTGKPDPVWFKDFDCKGSRPDCIAKAQEHARKVWAYQSWLFNSLFKDCTDCVSDDRELAASFLQGAGTVAKDVIILIDGLEGSTSATKQFRRDLENADAIVLALNLPGHGPDRARRNSVTYKDWVNEVQGAVRFAKVLGNNVHIIGQSTGGALAVVAAHENPDAVKSLLLVEPALKVQEYATFGACVGKYVVSDASWGGTVNLNMGCEVDKIVGMRAEGERTLSVQSESAAVREAAAAADRADYYRDIQAQTLILQNPNDIVVKNSEMNAFQKANPRVRIHQMSGAAGHGKNHFSQELYDHAIRPALLEYIRDVGIQPTRQPIDPARNSADVFARVRASPETFLVRFPKELATSEDLAHLLDGAMITRMSLFNTVTKCCWHPNLLDESPYDLLRHSVRYPPTPKECQFAGPALKILAEKLDIPFRLYECTRMIPKKSVVAAPSTFDHTKEDWGNYCDLEKEIKDLQVNLAGLRRAIVDLDSSGQNPKREIAPARKPKKRSYNNRPDKNQLAAVK
jgi:pimeloyl-ACP methyl ester carboxylesterase